MKTAIATVPENVIQITPRTKAKSPPPRIAERFKVQSFSNRSGTTSFRVTGIKRDGTRIRQNFTDLLSAQAKQVELNTEYLAQRTDTAVRATKLTETQLRLAEIAFLKLDSEQELLPAVDYWNKHGKQLSVQNSVRIDEAVEQFNQWLARQPDNELSPRTKNNLRLRVGIFTNSIGNVEVNHITPDMVFGFLDKREVSRRTKINDRLVLSRFFAWCKEPPRRWLAVNPARKEEKTKRMPKPSPVILSVDQCERLLQAAAKHRRGRLVPYVAVCLFGGLRPFEAARLTWDGVNLADGEIRLEASQCKTRRPRTVKIGKTLSAWLTRYKGKPFFPVNWRNDFDDVKRAAGFGNSEKDKRLTRWTGDVMRHTAISHYFRQCGSYGLTAEWAGNSEQIIKDHYQGKVSTEDTKKFYALLPKKGGRK
ncbi:MAG: site-specific tyrosine recombinase XerC [Verrucomicrobia bacterium ADurb.Bin063]|nr:MAG: site-specific tyrosine recombinase XerC [Verrucomicrobia bacterium ADurb.Bin063]